MSTFTFSELSGLRVLTVTGDVDIANCEELGQKLSDAGDFPPTVVDFSGCLFMDSSCLNVLIREKKRYGENLSLVVPTGSPIRRIFAVTNLERIFRILPSITEAQGALEETG